MVEYEQRDLILKEMGFASYAEYLASKLWARIRHRVFKRSRKCVCCKEPASEVHHKNYRPETMRGQDLSGLAALCSTCHELAEFNSDGSKAPLEIANQKIDMLSSLDRIATPQRTRPWRDVKRDAMCNATRPTATSYKKQGKKPSKRKMILAKIPVELLPAKASKKSRSALRMSMRLIARQPAG